MCPVGFVGTGCGHEDTPRLVGGSADSRWGRRRPSVHGHAPGCGGGVRRCRWRGCRRPASRPRDLTRYVGFILIAAFTGPLGLVLSRLVVHLTVAWRAQPWGPPRANAGGVGTGHPICGGFRVGRLVVQARFMKDGGR